MSKIYTIFFLIIIFFSINLNAQEVKDYNLYVQNPILYNPANAISSNFLQVYVNSHLQWINFGGTPKSNELGACINFFPNMGAGLSVTSLQAGLFNYFSANLKYAYQLKFEKDHLLKMGVSFGLNHDRIIPSLAENVDFSDEKLSETYFNRTVFTSGFGLFYNFKNFDAQIVMPQLFEYNKANIYTIGIVGYNFEITDNLDLKPSFLVRGLKASPGQFDANLMASWNKMFWGQLGYRSNNSFIFSVGAEIQNYSIGYAYQADTKPIVTSNSGTHEIQLIYKLNKEPKIEVPLKTKIFGTVTDLNDSTPIVANIVIYENSVKKYNVTTESKRGFYSLEVLPDKSYEFKITANGYKDKNELVFVPKNTKELEKNFQLKSNKVLVVGKTINVYTKTPVISKIVFLDGNRLIDSLITDSLGNFKISLPPDKIYTAFVTADNYISLNNNFTVKQEDTLYQVYELTPIFKLIGKITDLKTGLPIGADLEIYNNQTDEVVNIIKADTTTGLYEYLLKDLKDLTITATNPMYMFQSETVVIDNTQVVTEKNIALKPVELGAMIVLENVFFDTGKATLRPESITELNRLIGIMLQFPKIKVEISGHTDNVGSQSMNKKLSEDRAKSVVNYMVQNGVKKDRLKYVGYGPKIPRATNETPEGRQLNRRVEAKVISDK